MQDLLKAIVLKSETWISVQFIFFFSLGSKQQSHVAGYVEPASILTVNEDLKCLMFKYKIYYYDTKSKKSSSKWSYYTDSCFS